ncbi:MAG: alanine:cation symporter family protein [Eubacteriales bacterium]|nr:alanine:cation symporter family protein [Eubacteriales bacterium]
MWILAIVGAGTSFAEHSITQLYKTRLGGSYRGGAAFYIRTGIGGATGAFLGGLFAVLGYLSTGVLGALQPGAAADALVNGFGVPRIVATIVILAGLFVVLCGGIKGIGSFCEKIVPPMAVSYIVVALIIIVMNLGALPGVLATIVTSAFGKNAVFGGIVGSAISMGIKRGVYSSEAGQGTSTPHSATADTSHPAKQGLLQALSVYVDTILICTATAFMLLLSGQYNVYDAAGVAIYEALPGVEAGVGFGQAAADTIFPGFGRIFMASALLVFAFTTSITQYNLAESNAAALHRGFAENKWMSMALKLIYIFVPRYMGCMLDLDAVWSLSDLGMGLNAWLTLLTLLYFIPTTIKIYKDYFHQLAAGKDPVFRPSRCGIRNAELWEEIAGEYEAVAKTEQKEPAAKV